MVGLSKGVKGRDTGETQKLQRTHSISSWTGVVQILVDDIIEPSEDPRSLFGTIEKPF
jgi:hypothetical protein